PLVDLDGTGSASQAAGYDRRGGTAAEGVDHHATLARARPDEEVRQALRHHGFVLARRAVVLVVGLGYADHVAGIGAALQVRLGAVAAEAGLGVAAPVAIQLAA